MWPSKLGGPIYKATEQSEKWWRPSFAGDHCFVIEGREPAASGKSRSKLDRQIKIMETRYKTKKRVGVKRHFEPLFAGFSVLSQWHGQYPISESEV
jgi:hypothetical protein